MSGCRTHYGALKQTALVSKIEAGRFMEHLIREGILTVMSRQLEKKKDQKFALKQQSIVLGQKAQAVIQQHAKVTFALQVRTVSNPESFILKPSKLSCVRIIIQVCFMALLRLGCPCQATTVRNFHLQKEAKTAKAASAAARAKPAHKKAAGRTQDVPEDIEDSDDDFPAVAHDAKVLAGATSHNLIARVPAQPHCLPLKHAPAFRHFLVRGCQVHLRIFRACPAV
jgi:hypothetical protein